MSVIIIIPEAQAKRRFLKRLMLLINLINSRSFNFRRDYRLIADLPFAISRFRDASENARVARV
jgi:hypothetical protein